jgi:hypothetical protein
MCPVVRVQVRLGSIRLTFEGDQSFYEAHVESLLAAAAARSLSPGAAPRPMPAALAPVAPAASQAPAPATPARPERTAWSPSSGDFGRYIRRLGPEAGEADRQVVAFAFYLWNYERRETFGRSELLACFQALHLPAPDLDPILVDLTDRKRFLESAGADAWRLSKKGENYVKTRLLTA